MFQKKKIEYICIREGDFQNIFVLKKKGFLKDICGKKKKKKLLRTRFFLQCFVLYFC